MRIASGTFALLAFTVTAMAIAQSGFSTKADIETHLQALETPYDDTVFNRYLASLPSVTNPLMPDTKFFVVEGDLPLRAREVRDYLASRARLSSIPQPEPGELAVNVVDGARTFWATPGARRITYAVLRPTFPDTAGYAKVLTAMREAGNDWQAICASCGIEFVHIVNYDTLEPHQSVDKLETDLLRFIVVYNKSLAPSEWAYGFLPNHQKLQRQISVGPRLISPGSGIWTARGVLRHELGHVLGYRHEHIRGVAGCKRENGSWAPLTEYDGRSIMHYPCGESSAKRDFTFTELDIHGHRSLYRQ